MTRPLSIVTAFFLLVAAPGLTFAQETAASQSGPAPSTDIFDVWRAFRHKDTPADQTAWDYHKAMKAFAPVIGAKPSSGALFGAAGNVAFYRGDPATTRISSVVTSLTFSTKGQIALTDRFTMFGDGDRWRLEADHRFQWTSLETPPLGTNAETDDSVLADFDFFRLHHTAYYQLRPGLYAGGGFYFDNHINIGPREDDDETDVADWESSPFVTYSDAHGLPLDAQGSAGPSVDLLWDTRDSFINAARGWLAKISYRTSLDGLLGADRAGKVNLDVRTYQPLSSKRPSHPRRVDVRRFIVGGAAPYFDLPGTGLDTYGRSARGYGEGQFRGERLAHGEVEYRGTLMRNGSARNGGVRERHDDQQPAAGRRTIVRQRGDRRRRRVAPADQQALENEPLFRRRHREAGLAGRLPGGPGSVLIG